MVRMPHHSRGRTNDCDLEPEPALLSGPKRNETELNREERAGAEHPARMYLNYRRVIGAGQRLRARHLAPGILNLEYFFIAEPISWMSFFLRHCDEAPKPHVFRPFLAMNSLAWRLLFHRMFDDLLIARKVTLRVTPEHEPIEAQQVARGSRYCNFGIGLLEAVTGH